MSPWKLNAQLCRLAAELALVCKDPNNAVHSSDRLITSYASPAAAARARLQSYLAIAPLIQGRY